MTTVIRHVLERLKEIGITDVFGVPGDYAFSINDAICNDSAMRWIGCSNELNAAYAADGYARVKGMAALCTTYGVGALSAINGTAGAYAEHLPIFHLVGMPGMATQASRAIVHHTLGNGEYDLFRRMTEPLVCASAVMTPQNVAYETERLIAEALFHRRPSTWRSRRITPISLCSVQVMQFRPPQATGRRWMWRPQRSPRSWAGRGPPACCPAFWSRATACKGKCRK
jgi:indolepyruvate decarboxylase